MTGLSEVDRPRMPTISRKVNGFNRNDVVNAFVSAFEVIGGVNRLALWANANPDKFFPLYAKLLPATTQVIGDIGALEIIHRIAPTALDRHEPRENLERGDECLESSSSTSQENISPPSTQETSDGVSLSLIDEPERLLQQSTT